MLQSFPAFASDRTGSVLDGIVVSEENGLLFFSPAQGIPSRRLLYLNSYGGREIWKKIEAGLLSSHHLWGCLELARMGYEIAIAEPLPYFCLGRRSFPHDLEYLKFARSW